MSFNSMRNLRLPSELTKSPNRPIKSIVFGTPQKIEKVNPIRKVNSEQNIKLPQIISPRVPQTLQEIKNSYQTNKASKFSLNSKLDLLLDEIDATIKVETCRTRQISDSIDNRVQKINKHFKSKSRVMSTVEMEKVMFSKEEKNKAIDSYNNSLKSHYTNTASGIQYFRKNILHKEEQFGF